MRVKVDRGNEHAKFVFEIVQLCLLHSLAYWVENPDGSYLWRLSYWIASGLALSDKSYRFDMCRDGAGWRKRTRIATSCDLSKNRLLCLRDHVHIPLRGRSKIHKASWARVAQV